MAKVPNPAYWRTRWRSWIDPRTKPEGDRNLWDEFFALLHRREMWRGYREALEASPQDAQDAARWLTQWVQRNHIETQAIAIRRISNRSTHKATIALGRLLDEVAAHPEVLGAEAARQAGEDASRLEEVSRKVERFATKVVAHFDRDHAVVSQDLRFDDFDRAIELSTELFTRWFSKITGEGVAVDLLPAIPWQNVLRLHRRDLSIDNPDALGARVVYSLGEPAAQELLETLERSEEERAALIGRLYARDKPAGSRSC